MKKNLSKNIEAYTYNLEDGEIKKSKLNPKQVYEEIINEKWKAIRFTFPDVKVGSIIE